MPSSRPVSARHAPGHDIPEKIVVRCVYMARPSLPRSRGAAFAFAAHCCSAGVKGARKEPCPIPPSLQPGLPAARAAVAPSAEAIFSRAPSTRPSRGLAPPFKRCQCLRLLACDLASGCPVRYRLRAALLRHLPSCQVLGSIAATTIFFAFALTTFVLWIRCVSTLCCCACCCCFLAAAPNRRSCTAARPFLRAP
jgi:hypothetical protein